MKLNTTIKTKPGFNTDFKDIADVKLSNLTENRDKYVKELMGKSMKELRRMQTVVDEELETAYSRKMDHSILVLQKMREQIDEAVYKKNFKE